RDGKREPIFATRGVSYRGNALHSRYWPSVSDARRSQGSRSDGRRPLGLVRRRAALALGGRAGLSRRFGAEPGPLVQHQDDERRGAHAELQEVVGEKTLHLGAAVPDEPLGLRELVAPELVGRRRGDPRERPLTDFGEEQELEQLAAPQAEKLRLGLEHAKMGLGDGDGDL